ncbi:type II secretion system major pseudopilin GspG [Candidatus Nitrosacidococcus sp. I8]|uniref:type II secretion system major pseudopilin GspG n=1 Tax=Candidatus Nitrosacidococcus sp. I8 TaxID=2942908 RepID=UPI0022277BFF|nr:type II secretion system major pseudopilin GspG [Candidatus Nitrosacidococcus sp. I8]CAH9015116.1 Type II secretion system protein G [Candidatus Nitrosacidococcus sp. I8]
MKLKKFSRLSHVNKGFTLIELLVVLVILGLLAGLVGPQVMKYLGGAKSDSTRLQIENIASVLDLYRLDVGHYPSTSEGLQALIEAPAGAKNWDGPYLKKKQVPKDSWGNDYHYRSPGEHGPFDVYSLGADGVEGGEGENQDVASWE